MSARSNLRRGARIAVVGSGAVGGYYGAMLARAGHDVHFLMRRDLAHVREHGLTVRSPAGDFHLAKVSCAGRTEEIGPVDLVIIALKTTANGILPELLPPLLGEGTVLLTLQNGLGADEFLAEHFGGERVLGGLCFVCLNRTEPGVITHLGEGRITMGVFGAEGAGAPGVAGLAEAFGEAGVICSVTENLAAARWGKLVWNVPFNGLSIVGGGIDMAEILADGDLALLTRGLMREVISAAAALGHEIPEEMIGKQIEVTRAMGAYRPSSLIDFQEGREVEVESIWGEPYRRGAGAGAEVGRLEMLYRLICRAVGTRGG